MFHHGLLVGRSDTKYIQRFLLISSIKVTCKVKITVNSLSFGLVEFRHAKFHLIKLAKIFRQSQELTSMREKWFRVRTFHNRRYQASSAHFWFIYGLKMNAVKARHTKNKNVRNIRASFAAYDDKIPLEKDFFRSLRIYEPYIII